MSNNRIVFSTTDHWLSRLIRLFTSSPVSHASMLYFDEDYQQEVIEEATWPETRCILFWRFKQKNRIVKIWEPRFDISVGFRRAGAALAQPYDTGNLLGHAIVAIGRWFGRRWRNPWGNSKALACSELIARILVWSHYPGTDTWDPEAITPGDLYEFSIRDAQRAAQEVG